jgi:hypothetical protein
MMRPATSSGCSMRPVAWLTTESESSRGEFHVAPDFEFMFVTDIAGFENVKAELEVNTQVDPSATPAHMAESRIV